MGRKKNPTSDMDVGEKMRSPLAQRLDTLITDNNALKEFLNCTIQAINQYRLGTSRPSLENLCKIADFYGVSTDYLLGRTDVQTPDMDKRAMCEYTGLSEHTLQLLARLNTSKAYTSKFRQSVINHILSGDIFWSQTMEHLQSAWIFCKGPSSEINEDVATQGELLFEQLKALNMGGYTKYVAWKGELTSKMQIQFASDSMKVLFETIIADIIKEEGFKNGQH